MPIMELPFARKPKPEYEEWAGDALGKIAIVLDHCSRNQATLPDYLELTCTANGFRFAVYVNIAKE